LRVRLQISYRCPLIMAGARVLQCDLERGPCRRPRLRWRLGPGPAQV